MEGFLLLSECSGWFNLNQHKDRTVLITLASVGVTLVLFLLWFAASLVFRWRFQYRLNSLLLLVVAAAVPCSWLAAEMKIERNQWRAAKAITAAGGFAWAERTSLGRLLGDDSLVEVYNVVFRGKPITDGDLVPLRELRQLANLDLGNTQVTDAGLANLPWAR